MYGILAVVWHEKNTMFIRHWVCLPDGQLRLFETETEAHQFANKMENMARESGILGIGYRARSYPG